MKRLITAIRYDLLLQWRNGFFFAAAGVVAVWAGLLTQVSAVAPMLARLQWLLPAMLLNELVIVTFYFVGGLLLLEKGEGTLQAQSVSPLHTGEYVLSKVLTLTVAAVLQNLLIVALMSGIVVHWLPLVVGLTLGAVIFVLVGVIAVLRARSINEYLLPSILYLSALLLPMLPYAAGWEPGLLYVHPAQAPLLLLRAAIEPIAAWQALYAVLGSVVWIAVLFRYTLREFRRFVVVAGEG